MPRARCMFLLLCLLTALPLQAQQLTLDAIFSQYGLAGPAPEQLQWSPDGATLTYILEEAATAKRNLWAMDAEAGEPHLLIPHEQLASMAPSLVDATQDERERERLRRYAVASYLWSPDSRSLLFSSAGSLFLYDLETNAARELTPGLGGVKYPKFSPNGHYISFVYENDIWLAEIEGSGLRRFTMDGTPDLLHGDLDWVYPEEFGVRSGYMWSPDSERIAFLEIDQSRVPTYPITTLTTVQPSVDLQRYPKAGDPNPQVRLGVAEVGRGHSEPTWFEFNDEYLPRFAWANSERLTVQTLDRAQKNLRLEAIDIAAGKRFTLLTERDPAWINVQDDLRFLEDGERFLWSSERTGLRHLYLYDGDGNLLEQLTEGEWEVSGIAGIDREAEIVYFTANRDNPIGSDLYAVRLSGGAVRRVTSGIGVHQPTMNGAATHYADAYSTLQMPGGVVAASTGGGNGRVIHEARKTENYKLAEPELAVLKTEDGAVIRTLLLKPSRLERGKKYPLIVYVYSGPHAPTIRDSWDLRGRYQFHQRLAQQGFVVAYVDDRASSLLGHKYETALAGNYGPTALADQLTALDHFKQLPFVDDERIGIWGWSGGGFAAAFALTHSDVFRAGIAVAPVTDWRLYDSIYTERYMGLPRVEHEAYRRTSAVEAAANLQGRLLLIHGTSDDNVHPQNTLRLIDALIDAGKPYELQLYPGQTHGISGDKDRLHAFRVMEEFWIRQLRDATPPERR